jgi:hypothetical protein
MRSEKNSEGGPKMSTGGIVIQLKQEPVMLCPCGNPSWHLICEPGAGEPDHIIAFECAQCRYRIQCDVHLIEEI